LSGICAKPVRDSLHQAAVIAAWDRVPQAVRAGIVAMIQAAAK
jgi:hypothetical protein